MPHNLDLNELEQELHATRPVAEPMPAAFKQNLRKQLESAEIPRRTFRFNPRWASALGLVAIVLVGSLLFQLLRPTETQSGSPSASNLIRETFNSTFNPGFTQFHNGQEMGASFNYAGDWNLVDTTINQTGILFEYSNRRRFLDRKEVMPGEVIGFVMNFQTEGNDDVETQMQTIDVFANVLGFSEEPAILAGSAETLEKDIGKFTVVPYTQRFDPHFVDFKYAMTQDNGNAYLIGIGGVGVSDRDLEDQLGYILNSMEPVKHRGKVWYESAENEMALLVPDSWYVHESVNSFEISANPQPLWSSYLDPNQPSDQPRIMLSLNHAEVDGADSAQQAMYLMTVPNYDLGKNVREVSPVELTLDRPDTSFRMYQYDDVSDNTVVEVTGIVYLPTVNEKAIVFSVFVEPRDANETAQVLQDMMRSIRPNNLIPPDADNFYSQETD